MVLAAYNKRFFIAAKLWKIISVVSKAKNLFADVKDKVLYDEAFSLVQVELEDAVKEKAYEEATFLAEQRGTETYNVAILELTFSGCKVKIVCQG